MQVGDNVIISATGMKEYMDESDNPHNTLGVIVDDYGGIEFRYKVTWRNGEYNVYSQKDIQVIKC